MTKWQDLQDIIDGTKKKRDVKKKAAGVVAVSTVVGGVAGVLLAPKPGRETRAKLIKKTKSGLHKTKDVAEDTEEKVKDKAETAVDKTKNAASTGKDAVKKSTRSTSSRNRS